MTDLLEQAAAELRRSLDSPGPSVDALRIRAQQRRRRQLAGGLMVVGLSGAVVGLAYRASPGDEVSVSASAPNETVISESTATVAVATNGGLTPGCAAMPDLVGLEEVPAVVRLGGVVTGWREAERQSMDTPAGVVLEQSPAPGTPVCPDAEVLITVSIAPYIVQSGDTYDSIAAANTVTVEALLDANARTLQDPLVPGDRLLIPGRDTPAPGAGDSTVFATIPTTTTGAATSSSEESGPCFAHYEVKPEDTMALIAAKFDLTLIELADANPDVSVLAPGDIVNIPYTLVSADGSQVTCDLNGERTG